MERAPISYRQPNALIVPTNKAIERGNARLLASQANDPIDDPRLKTPNYRETLEQLTIAQKDLREFHMRPLPAIITICAIILPLLIAAIVIFTGEPRHSSAACKTTTTNHVMRSAPE